MSEWGKDQGSLSFVSCCSIFVDLGKLIHLNSLLHDKAFLFSTNQRPGNWRQTHRQTFWNTGPGLSLRALDKKINPKLDLGEGVKNKFRGVHVLIKKFREGLEWCSQLKGVHVLLRIFWGVRVLQPSAANLRDPSPLWVFLTPSLIKPKEAI